MAGRIVTPNYLLYVYQTSRLVGFLVFYKSSVRFEGTGLDCITFAMPLIPFHIIDFVGTSLVSERLRVSGQSLWHFRRQS